MKRILSLSIGLILLAIGPKSWAQNSFFQQWEPAINLKTEYLVNKKGKGSFSISIAAGFKRRLFKNDSKDPFLEKIGNHFYFFYQPAINLYSGGLGDQLIDDLKRTEIDFVFSLGGTLGFGDKPIVANYIYHQPFNSMTGTAVSDEFNTSITFGTNLVSNVHSRNQIIGFLNANMGRLVQVGYYNDGPPFNYVGFADGNDRWWTGGGFINIHSDQGYVENSAYFKNLRFTYTYDRFTGNVQKAFELADVFSFKYVPAAKLRENYYNNSRGKFAIQLYPYELELSYHYLGRLRYDIQRRIHKLLNFPYHITFAKSYYAVGVQSSLSKSW